MSQRSSHSQHRYHPYQSTPTGLGRTRLPVPPLNSQHYLTHSFTSYSPFLESLTCYSSYFTKFGQEWIRSYLIKNQYKENSANWRRSIRLYNQLKMHNHLPIQYTTSLEPLSGSDQDFLHSAVAHLDHDMKAIGTWEPLPGEDPATTEHNLGYLTRQMQNWKDWVQEMTAIKHNLAIQLLSHPCFPHNLVNLNPCKD